MRSLWYSAVPLVLGSIALFGIEITPNALHQSLPPHTQIFIDHNHATTIHTVQRKAFKPTYQESLGFGYSLDMDVWIRIDLHNPTDMPLQKILPPKEKPSPTLLPLLLSYHLPDQIFHLSLWHPKLLFYPLY